MGLFSKTWTITTGGRRHVVELKQSLASATCEVHVDGRCVRGPGVRGETMTGGDFPFELDGKRCVVHLRPGLLSDHTDVTIDGVSVAGGGPRPDDLAGHREKGRTYAGIFMVVVGVGLAGVLRDRYTINGIPAYVLGGAIAVIGVFALLGANVFRSGPLDRRDDPPRGRR